PAWQRGPSPSRGRSRLWASRSSSLVRLCGFLSRLRRCRFALPLAFAVAFALAFGPPFTSARYSLTARPFSLLLRRARGLSLLGRLLASPFLLLCRLPVLGTLLGPARALRPEPLANPPHPLARGLQRGARAEQGKHDR